MNLPWTSQSFRSSPIIDHLSRVSRLGILPRVHFLGTVFVKVLLPKYSRPSSRGGVLKR